ncbi:MAG: FprA family A-type flavoprotein [Spirochaetaceae bacterium]|nr:MAG: FprA family A-type flavoprotein [Spirochaetaceae bacterium]
MKATLVTDGVYRLSANVDNILFEGMWPVPNGVAMNSYIVKGEKCAIIDGVCAWDGVPETLLAQLDELDIDVNDIDYVIINHMEPDHSGWLDAFAKVRKDFTIYTSERAKPLLEAFYRITDNIQLVKSGDTLDLGNGRVLAFEEIPNVHWPETMATYDTKSKTLFPCDAFGSFGSVADDAPYDDTLQEEHIEFFEREMERYYANIVTAFSQATQKAIEKTKALDVKIIAPGHGIVWRRHPDRVIRSYTRLASYAKGPARAEVAVIWGSMYGMTEMGVEPVIDAIESQGVKTRVHRIPESGISYVLDSVLQCSGVAIGMPTYEYKMFPPMAAVLDEIGKKKIMNRKAFRFGSFGWSGGAQKELTELDERLKMKWDYLEPVEFKGRPTDEDIALLRKRGVELAKAVKIWALGDVS